MSRTSERGYGTEHQRERRRWQREVDAGRACCTRCGMTVEPGQPWDLDHTDDRTGYLGAAHARCNRRAGGRKGNARRRRGRTTSRAW